MNIDTIYPTFQGEGTWTGLPVVLVRTYGCNGVCPFCDTPGGPSAMEMSVVQVVKECNRLREDYPYLQHILLTGGEPGLVGVVELEEFYLEANEAGWGVHVESNGTLSLGYDIRPFWVCVSPKPAYTPPLDAIEMYLADEIKLVYEGVGSEVMLAAFLRDFRITREKVCIQPLWDDGELQAEAVAFAMRQGFRLSFQVHKYLGWK